MPRRRKHAPSGRSSKDRGGRLLSIGHTDGSTAERGARRTHARSAVLLVSHRHGRRHAMNMGLGKRCVRRASLPRMCGWRLRRGRTRRNGAAGMERRETERVIPTWCMRASALLEQTHNAREGKGGEARE